MPQWSPVISTGKTRYMTEVDARRDVAAMEPGHIDREDDERVDVRGSGREAAMEPGHIDREDTGPLIRHPR